MRKVKQTMILVVSLAVMNTGCKSWNKTQKGAAIGTAAGAATGAVIGKAAGNTALGAIIGATVGGVTGAVIGHKMDKQAEEIKKDVPGAKVERVGEGIVVEFSNNVLFGFDQSDLTYAAKNTLNDLYTILKKYPDTNLEIQGHTDNVGSESYNLRLSKRRASSVSDYLHDKGVSTSRITTRGMGEDYPKYSNDTDDGRAQNRRVEFLITANEKMVEEARQEAGKNSK